MKRIIGQCNQVHFAGIEHLVSTIDKPEQFDVSTLTKSQQTAFASFAQASKKGISWTLMRDVVKEILLWSEGEGKPTTMEIRLRRTANPGKRKEFKRLWG